MQDAGVQSLRVRLLGDLQVEGCDPSRLGRRQLRTLIKVLALQRNQPVGVDRLVDCLWDDAPPARPGDQISVLVSRLRSVVGAERVRRGDGGYTLTVDWLDVDALAEYEAEAERRLAAGAVGAARAAAAAGLSLVRGPLLADEPDARWADAERATAERLVARLSHTAAAAAVAAADWSGAVDLANRALLGDPYDEAGLRVLMEALARSGRPASALAAYAEFRRRLADDLGASPSLPTETLHTAILMSDDPAPHGPTEDLPGRGQALATLRALLGRTESGHGGVGVVEGEAGIGKSRLLRVWTAELANTDVVTIACDELGRTLPLQPLFDVVAELVRRRGVEDILGPDVAVLGPLLGTQLEPPGSAQLAVLTDPRAGQALLFAALFSVVRRHAVEMPFVIVLDDVHLADVGTTAWLGQAARRLADTRVLIVAARRAEEGAPIPGATTIELGPLDLEAATAIVGPGRAAELHARSGGHPLFLVELAAAGDDLPDSIRDAVEERCERAGPAAATLRTAAVLDARVNLDVLAAVTGAPPGQLLDHLEEGVRRRLLVEQGATFVFAHALVRDALAATVGASRAAFIHRQAARALTERAGTDPLAIARHARLGGETAHASRMLVTAARMAVARFDREEALRLLDEAVALDDTTDGRLERARVHSTLAHYELAAADVEAARMRGAGAEALEVAAWSAHFQRRFGDALALADRGARDATDPDVRNSCRALGGWVSLASGDLAGAGRRLDGASPLSETWLAWLRVNQGRSEEALRLVHPEVGRGLAVYRFPNAYALMAGTMALGMLGRAEEALATLDTLEGEVARMGAGRWTPRPLNLRGWILRNLGASEEADELNQAGIEAAQPLGMAEPLANGLLDLAAGRLMADDFDAAGALLDEAGVVGGVEHAFRWRHQLRARLLRARLALGIGNRDEASAGAASLAASAAALGVPRYEVQARLVGAMADGRRDDVGDLLLRLERLAGLEAWWITAEAARAFGVEEWAELARRRVAALIRFAGARAPGLERFAARRLA